jgi:peptidyl-prolyl cis-trans isomerase A (cyclophilin A)
MKKLWVIFACLIALPCLSHAATANPRIEMTTNKGSITITLFADKAPKTVANFLQYVREGFYTNTIFHRVINGFMIQGGGFDERMNPKPTRAPITNEAANGLKNNAGTLAMARTSDPHSASAQFFINLKNNRFLDHPGQDGWGYAVFGQVTSGMDVVETIGQLPTGVSAGHRDVPLSPVRINAIKILTQEP